MILAYIVGNLAGGIFGLTGLGGLVAFGWGVHLLTDAWTVHGVPLFWPITSARVRLPPWLSTGSMMEAVVLVMALTVLTAYAVGPYVWPYLTPSTSARGANVIDRAARAPSVTATHRVGDSGFSGPVQEVGWLSVGIPSASRNI